MTRFYLDTSAAAKLLVEEPESTALAAWTDAEDVDLVSTHLLETELRRLAHRLGLPQADVSEILLRVARYDLPASLYTEAGLLVGAGLRSLDALHLAAAIRLDVVGLVAYDVRLTRAARDLGIAVVAPS